MSSPTSGEEWISLHEAAQILNMKPSEMHAVLVKNKQSKVRADVNGRIFIQRSDVLAMRVQE